jgi:hypothetical protein
VIRDPVAEFGALIEEVKFASDSPLARREMVWGRRRGNGTIVAVAN